MYVFACVRDFINPVVVLAPMNSDISLPIFRNTKMSKSFHVKKVISGEEKVSAKQKKNMWNTGKQI